MSSLDHSVRPSRQLAAHWSGEHAKLLMENAPEGSRLVVLTPKQIEALRSSAVVLRYLADSFLPAKSAVHRRTLDRESTLNEILAMVKA